MGWIVKEGDNTLRRAANDNQNPELSMSGKTEAGKLPSIDSLKAAMASFEPLKAANDNLAPFESRRSPSVEAPENLAQVTETAVKKGVEKVSTPTYSNLSGLDISRLPKNVPEARGIISLIQIANIESRTNAEIAPLEEFSADAEEIINYIRSRNFTGMSGEYFDRVIAASEKKVAESTARAATIVAESAEQISAKKGEVSETDPKSIKVFETLLTMSGKIEMKWPTGFNGVDGKYLWSANAGGANSVQSMIAAMTSIPKKAELKAANDNLPVNEAGEEPMAEAA